MSSAHPDPAFPRLHGRPGRGWVNDPNGCSYVDGRFHLFFQYNPDAPVHAAIKVLERFGDRRCRRAHRRVQRGRRSQLPIRGAARAQ
jgi:hypothetical protein